MYYGERIRADEGDFMEATASPREIARFRLVKGDVLVTKDSEDWRDIAVPALIEETAGDFVCGYHLGLIRPSSSLEPAFLFRVMQSVVVNQQLQTICFGSHAVWASQLGRGRDCRSRSAPLRTASDRCLP